MTSGESGRAHLIHELMLKMIGFDAGDPKRIQHFIKVHSLARTIGTGEGADDDTLFTLEAAAIVHDIGIHPAEEKHAGRCDGKLQELEGPAPARAMLEGLGFPPSVTDGRARHPRRARARLRHQDGTPPAVHDVRHRGRVAPGRQGGAAGVWPRPPGGEGSRLEWPIARRRHLPCTTICATRLLAFWRVRCGTARTRRSERYGMQA